MCGAAGIKHMKLKDYYPFPEFRQNIEEALDKLEEALQSKRFFIIRGRTGCGKSAIAIALSRKLNCNILTATKLLQDQYSETKEFDSEYVLKGKANYNCSLTGCTMNSAPCASKKLFSIAKRNGDFSENLHAPSELRAKCIEKSRCEYYEKKQILASDSGGAIINYDLALSMNSSKPERPSIVLDEAHNFISKVLDFYSFEYSRRRLESLVGVADAPCQANFVGWLERVMKLAAIKSEMSATPQERDSLMTLKEKCKNIISDAPHPTDYFIRYDDNRIDIKPINPKLTVGKFLNKFAKVFFLSATMDATFANTLGLPESSTITLDIESDFPIANRPVLFPSDLPNINYQTQITDDLPAIQVLDAIIDAHKGERGVIHTANYRTFLSLQGTYSNNPRFTWVEQGADKKYVLGKHAENEGSILVSPALIEGVDLHGELARWQVIFKIPFPARSDYQNALEERIPGLYGMTTRNAVVQAYGRCVRSRDDFARTYVLDGSLRYLIPDLDTYFTSAIRTGPWRKLILALNAKSKKTLKGSANS